MQKKKEKLKSSYKENVSVSRNGRIVSIPAEKLPNFEAVGWKKVEETKSVRKPDTVRNKE